MKGVGKGLWCLMATNTKKKKGKKKAALKTQMNPVYPQSDFQKFQC